MQWPTALKQICCRGPKHERTLKVEYLGRIKSLFKTALDHKSGNQITFDKKYYANVPLKCSAGNLLYFLPLLILTIILVKSSFTDLEYILHLYILCLLLE